MSPRFLKLPGAWSSVITNAYGPSRCPQPGRVLSPPGLCQGRGSPSLKSQGHRQPMDARQKCAAGLSGTSLASERCSQHPMLERGPVCGPAAYQMSHSSSAPIYLQNTLCKSNSISACNLPIPFPLLPTSPCSACRIHTLHKKSFAMQARELLLAPSWSWVP